MSSNKVIVLPHSVQRKVIGSSYQNFQLLVRNFYSRKYIYTPFYVLKHVEYMENI